MYITLGIHVLISMELEVNTMNTIEISGMSTIERLQTMEAIWDSLIHENSEIESPNGIGIFLHPEN